jgi:hypothetical protein
MRATRCLSEECGKTTVQLGKFKSNNVILLEIHHVLFPYIVFTNKFLYQVA